MTLCILTYKLFFKHYILDSNRARNYARYLLNCHLCVFTVRFRFVLSKNSTGLKNKIVCGLVRFESILWKKIYDFKKENIKKQFFKNIEKKKFPKSV